jgi:pSer/pThr/pTyr-binding forkhead associated (FHA) protein
MNVRLVVEQGSRRKVVPLKTDVSVIGRSRGNAVRIPSADVSRRHCRLLQRDGLVMLEDMGSVNGTFLNGQRIKNPEVVRPGDHLEVGPVTFVVEYELTPEALDHLRSLEDGDVLAGLAEGVPLDDEEMPVLEFDEEAPAEEEAVPILDSDEPLEADFDFDAAPWQMPQGGDLRDILSHMEDEDEPPTQRHRPNRR